MSRREAPRFISTGGSRDGRQVGWRTRWNARQRCRVLPSCAWNGIVQRGGCARLASEL